MRTQDLPKGQGLAAYQAFRNQFQPALRSAVHQLEDAGVDPVMIVSRLKTAASLMEKVEGPRQKARIHDIVGTTALTERMDQIPAMVEKLRKFMDIREVDDQYMHEPGNGYYVATHLTAMVDGVPVEVQVMSKEMLKLKLYAQETVYKGERRPEDVEYVKAQREYLQRRERGEAAQAPAKPSSNRGKVN